jgi:acyl-CoA thioester hydrolase
MSRIPPETRDKFVYFCDITTRWKDNDVFGHVNNVVYYSYFDTCVTGYSIAQGILDPKKSPTLCLVIETQCRYHSSIAFPDIVHVGLRVAKLGNSSVRYEIGIFKNDETIASAEGHFVHVYVDRETNRPVPMPAEVVSALSKLKLPETTSNT